MTFLSHWSVARRPISAWLSLLFLVGKIHLLAKLDALKMLLNYPLPEITWKAVDLRILDRILLEQTVDGTGADRQTFCWNSVRNTAILQTPFCMRGFTIHDQNRVFYEWKQKNFWMGTFPWSQDHHSCTMAFGNPLLYVWEKKTLKSLSLPELEPFKKFTIPLENLPFHWKYVSLWEGISEHCGLSPLRGPSAGAISGVQPSSLRGERRSVG